MSANLAAKRRREEGRRRLGGEGAGQADNRSAAWRRLAESFPDVMRRLAWSKAYRPKAHGQWRPLSSAGREPLPGDGDMEIRAEQQPVIVEVVAGIMQRRRGLAIA